MLKGIFYSMHGIIRKELEEEMKYTPYLPIVTVILLTLTACCSAEENLSVPEELSISQTQVIQEQVLGNNEFAMDLYQELCGSLQSDNIFFSPYSISSALGMAYAGARGQTAADMAEALHFRFPVEVLNRAFYSLTEELNSEDFSGAEEGEPFTLTIVNGLWVQDGINLLDDYVSEVTRYYSAAVRNLDFINDPEGSSETINEWIAESTRDRIKDLISPGTLNEETRVVLTNAVYFNAAWLKPFDERATTDAPFEHADRSTVDVPMMKRTDYFRYASTEGCSAVELDYAAGNASMLIILPDGSITDFQQTFDADKLETVRRRLSSCNVSLSMPRFEFTESIQLRPVLSAMGMGSAFMESADFSGITGSQDLFISDVLHKAFVKVDETGTEAAAATALIMGITAMPLQPVEMTINRPFMFFIIDNGTGSIVFMGRVMDPSV